MTDFIDLQRIINIILRRWWLLVMVTALSAILGSLVSERQTPVYEATTTVLVGQIFQSTNIDRQEILTSELVAQTYSDLVRRQPVLQSVVETLNLSQTWQQLRKRVSVELVEGTQLIQITVEANSSSTAQKIADEVARQMILFTPTESNAEESDEVRLFVKQQIENLQDRIESGQNKLALLESSMARAGSVDRLLELQAESTTLESQLTNWENSYIQLLGFLQTGQSPNTLTIIEPAQATPGPVNPQVQFFVFLGGALGVLLGLGLIFLLEYLEDTYKAPDEITRGLGLPVLGSIHSPRKSNDASTGVYIAKYPRSSIAEAYRLLRANLDSISADRPLKTIMVTSCDRGVGKSSVSTNLAITLAQSDRETILLDADLRRPNIHFFLDLNNNLGLSDILLNRREIDEAMWEYDDIKCGVITGGASPANPSELIGSKKMDQTLARLKETNKVVLLDSSPLNVSDAFLLSAKVDGILLVVRLGYTRKKLVKRALQQLDRAEVGVIGVVLTGAKGRDGTYYGADRHSIDERFEASGRFTAVRKSKPVVMEQLGPVPSKGSNGLSLAAEALKLNGSQGSSANGDWPEEIAKAEEIARPQEITETGEIDPDEGGPDSRKLPDENPIKPTKAKRSKRSGANGDRPEEIAKEKQNTSRN